jgi:hypothetical protein
MRRLLATPALTHLVCRWTALALLSVLSMPGCARPLLSPNEERSPFDRYDGIRNQYSAQFVEDEFGRQRPNLRERLAPKD